ENRHRCADLQTMVPSWCHDQATARVATEIGDAYPFLTAKAVEKLAKCFWYVWRSRPRAPSTRPAHECDGHRMGADAVARGPERGVGGTLEGGPLNEHTPACLSEPRSSFPRLTRPRVSTPFFTRVWRASFQGSPETT